MCQTLRSTELFFLILGNRTKLDTVQKNVLVTP